MQEKAELTVSEEAFRWSIRLLAHLAGELTNAWCAGSEKCSDRFKWLATKPVVGDMVVEVSTHGTPQGERGLDHFNRIGRYLGTEVETSDDGSVTHQVIVLADGTWVRWNNCDLRRVPEETLHTLCGPLYGQIGRVPLREGGSENPEQWAARRGLNGRWYQSPHSRIARFGQRSMGDDREVAVEWRGDHAVAVGEAN